MPEQGEWPRTGFRCPSHLIEAAEQLAEKRYSRHDKWTPSRIYRDALRDYLANADDLPEETRDLLDDDLKANAGGDAEEGETR
jgi:hypothetical protein